MSSPSLVEAASLTLVIAGSACAVGWPLFTTRRGMLLAQLLLTACFGLHHAIEGATTAAVLNGLSALQVAAVLILGRSQRLWWAGHALIPAAVVGALVTWNGAPSLLALIGSLLISVGRVQVDPRALQLLVLAGTPFWLAHDIVVGSPVMIGDALGLAVGLATLARRTSAPLPAVAPRQAALYPTAWQPNDNLRRRA
jgi:hypothetical protein